MYIMDSFFFGHENYRCKLALSLSLIMAGFYKIGNLHTRLLYKHTVQHTHKHNNINKYLRLRLHRLNRQEKQHCLQIIHALHHTHINAPRSHYNIKIHRHCPLCYQKQPGETRDHIYKTCEIARTAYEKCAGRLNRQYQIKHANARQIAQNIATEHTQQQEIYRKVIQDSNIHKDHDYTYETICFLARATIWKHRVLRQEALQAHGQAPTQPPPTQIDAVDRERLIEQIVLDWTKRWQEAYPHCAPRRKASRVR
jgi:hypothetical protein